MISRGWFGHDQAPLGTDNAISAVERGDRDFCPLYLPVVPVF